MPWAFTSQSEIIPNEELLESRCVIVYTYSSRYNYIGMHHFGLFEFLCPYACGSLYITKMIGEPSVLLYVMGVAGRTPQKTIAAGGIPIGTRYLGDCVRAVDNPVENE